MKILLIFIFLFTSVSLAKSEMIRLKCEVRVEENNLLTKQQRTSNKSSFWTVTTVENLSVPFLIGNFKEKDCEKFNEGEVLCKKQKLQPYNDIYLIGSRLTFIVKLNRNTGEFYWSIADHTWDTNGDIKHVITSEEGVCEKFVQKKIF